ncbi:SusD/RagB family nutrient-binding outer membrane lipoprotein [Sphingobacterium sp. WQ 366]|uniref:SusD/RagB family nutrient-binding outer membrane lipoprotein n=2 Tax=Sphingobacterium bovistauri TaxID=2781959 RepID=A0ABS7Z687_9SPHI|nr:SusD/RagB family nutrient-binding outer membrane lipoprotein [Sphingobacterium bovistauri]
MNIRYLIKNKVYLVLAVVFAVSCTKNFEEYNTHPYNPQDKNLTEAERLGTLIPTLISTMHFSQENRSQHTEQFVFGQYGGYFATTNNWNGTNFGTLNPALDWVEVPYKDVMAEFNSNYLKIKEVTNSTGYIYAWVNIIRVASMLRMLDTYGPIPYSKIGESNNDQVPFDSVEDVYKKMFSELDESLAVLNRFILGSTNYKNNPMAMYDGVYQGDFAKWVKFANSLKMRMAMRLSNVDATFASAKFLEAHQAGPIIANTDNAFIPTQDNPYLKASVEWGDLAISASLSSYMNGYADPRSSKYMTAISGGSYRGVRMGIQSINKTTFSNANSYSKPAFTKATPLLIFNASEVAFLRAEAALKGWLTGGDAVAKTYYEQGVTLSMSANNVTVGSYLTSTAVPAQYTSPNLSRSNISVPNRITVSWSDFSTSVNTKLEKIITQKWLANYPYGSESWADIRRTGFPQIYPALDNLSSSSFIGSINNSYGRMVRRLTYPQSLYRTNNDLVTSAISLLGGDDAGSTDLWWAKKN